MGIRDKYLSKTFVVEQLYGLGDPILIQFVKNIVQQHYRIHAGFFLDKVNTPVLIMHNDKDGAVPWYQGIEYFVGLRRLGKPAWMLNYNGDPHWAMKFQNRVDFNIRMQQYFDYYLMDTPKPKWMDRGVPAMEKGIDQGYELMKE